MADDPDDSDDFGFDHDFATTADAATINRLIAGILARVRVAWPGATTSAARDRKPVEFPTTAGAAPTFDRDGIKVAIEAGGWRLYIDVYCSDTSSELYCLSAPPHPSATDAKQLLQMFYDAATAVGVDLAEE